MQATGDACGPREPVEGTPAGCYTRPWRPPREGKITGDLAAIGAGDQRRHDPQPRRRRVFCGGHTTQNLRLLRGLQLPLKRRRGGARHPRRRCRAQLLQRVVAHSLGVSFPSPAMPCTSTLLPGVAGTATTASPRWEPTSASTSILRRRTVHVLAVLLPRDGHPSARGQDQWKLEAVRALVGDGLPASRRRCVASRRGKVCFRRRLTNILSMAMK